MLSRYQLNRTKRWIYGPLEWGRYLCLKSSGALARLHAEQADCHDAQDYLAFAKKHFPPCQIDSEILSFLEWLNTWSPEVIVEIGVARGGNTYLLTHCASSVRKIVGVDLFARNQRALKALAKPPIALNFVSGMSSAEATCRRVREFLGDEKIDLLFIDGDHSYQGVMADFNSYCGLVKKNGWVAFHDIVPQRKDAEGNAINGFEVEVDRAWNELSRDKVTRRFVEREDQYSYGIGVLQL